MTFQYGIVAIIVVLLVIIFLWKGIKKIAAWALLIILAIALFGTVFGLDLFNDITDITENFPTARKLFLLNDDGIRAGFELSVLGTGDVSFIDAKTLTSYQSSLKDLDAVRGDYYKLIIIDAKAFTVNNLSINGNDLSASQVLEVIRSDNPRERAVDFIRSSQSLPDTPEVRRYIEKQLKDSSIETDADMRASLFAQLFVAEMGKSPLSLTRGMTQSTITIYPETITFKVIKILPESITEKIIQNLQ
ncbi:MAG TPA: hypothetical protein VJK72_03490 [Candidatus Nanoarchaeia archaeon]|nr:hypothetical protein [Candidatus Nanoarchaeia archaeon]